MDKSYNSVLRELFVGSLNEADISPELNYVQTLQTCVSNVRYKVSDASVLKLDTAWKKC